MIDSSQNLLHLAGIPLMTHAEWSGGSIFAEIGPGGFLVLGFLSLDDGFSAAAIMKGGGGERWFLPRRLKSNGER